MLKPFSTVLLLLGLAGFTHASESKLDEVERLSGVKGGLCVQLECEDGQTLAEIARSGRFLAHGISTEEKCALSLRQRFAAECLSGFASAECLPLQRLPFADNLVNVLLTENLSQALAKGVTLAECLRVLSPRGVALMGVAQDQQKDTETLLGKAGIKDFKFEKGSRLWLVIRKPRPAGMDDWTHWNHGPDGNLVSNDQLLERPNQIQWITGEHWGSSRTAGVPGAGSPAGVRSANGRNFYIMGELVARDAFNGVMLWHRKFAGLNHKLVIAAGDEVYLHVSGELLALDAATGKDLRSFGKTEGCRDLHFANGLLLSYEAKGLRAFDTATGKEKWSSVAGASSNNAVVADGRIFIQKGSLTCLDLATGESIWKKDAQALGGIVYAFGDKLLLRTAANKFTALAGKNGSELWSFDAGGKPGLTYFASGLVWVQRPDNRAARKTAGFHNPQGGEAYKWEGLDPATGAVQKTLEAPVMLDYRCHLIFATDRFLIGNRPMYFTSWKDGSVNRFEGTRMACGSSCGLGQGLFFGLYTNSNLCMCVRQAISGISAFASDGKTINGEVPTEAEGRLVQGPAQAPDVQTAKPQGEWPIYRCDARRTSGNGSELPADLSVAWQRNLLASPEQKPKEPAASNTLALLRNDWLLNKVSGDPLAQPTVAAGRVFVTLTHAQQVVALDQKTGECVWTFFAPARLDAPPSIEQGMCLVGCNDGWVYGLRADNGQQVWRFRAAPAERRIVAYGQVESAWPVVGGVLIANGAAYVVAGRTTECDGGLYVHALDVRTGKPLWSERRLKPDDGAIGAWNLRGISSTYFGPADLLVSDGKTLAIAGHNKGSFDCKNGESSPSRSFSGPHFGWMKSRYASDNQKMDYPPRAVLGAQTSEPFSIQDKATKQSRRGIALSGGAGWKTELPDANATVEALAGAGNPAGGRSKQSAPNPVVRASKASARPKIDGEIDEAFLKEARPLAFSFLNGAPGKPKQATTAYVLCDEANLYLAVRCETPDPERLICRKTKHDDNVWEDECVEIFLDPRGSRTKEYFHIIVNSAGITQDAFATDVSWNPALSVAGGKEKGKAWTVELQISLNDLALKGEKLANGWSLNLNRSARKFDRPEECEDTAWSPTRGNSSHVPEMFGHLWLDAMPDGRDEAAFTAWSQKTGQGAQTERATETASQSRCAILAALSRNAQGVAAGSLLVLSALDGSKLACLDLPAAPVFEGLSVANEKVYVTLRDGTIICFKGSK